MDKQLEILARAIKKSEHEIELDINRPKYFDAWTAKEYGIIDRVRSCWCGSKIFWPKLKFNRSWKADRCWCFVNRIQAYLFSEIRSLNRVYFLSSSMAFDDKN